MNVFEKLEEVERKTGAVVELTKDIELKLDNLILDYIIPKNIGFTRDIILNSSILTTGNKIKILKNICNKLNVKQDFADLHKLVNIRNVFAHGKPFVEGEDEIFRLFEIKGDGKTNKVELDKLHDKFINLFNQQTQMLIKLHSKIKVVDKSSC